jgi:hypothetical protein
MTRESPKKRSNARQDRLIAEMNARNADIIDPMRESVFAGGGTRGLQGAKTIAAKVSGFTKPMTEAKTVTMPRRSIKYQIPQVQLEELHKKIKQRDSFSERTKRVTTQVAKESKYIPVPAQRKDEKK